MVRNLTYVWLPVPLNIFFYCFSLHLFTFWGNFSATSCCTPNKWHSKQVPLLLPFSRENCENFFFGCYMLRPLFSLSRRFRYLSLCETSSLFLSKHVKKKRIFFIASLWIGLNYSLILLNFGFYYLVLRFCVVGLVGWCFKLWSNELVWFLFLVQLCKLTLVVM